MNVQCRDCEDLARGLDKGADCEACKATGRTLPLEINNENQPNRQQRTNKVLMVNLENCNKCYVYYSEILYLLGICIDCSTDIHITHDIK